MARFLVASSETKEMRPVGQKSQPNWEKIFSQLGRFFFPVREAKMGIYKRCCSMAIGFAFLHARDFLLAFRKFLTKPADELSGSVFVSNSSKIETGSNWSF